MMMMMMMTMWGEEFWRENINIDGDGRTWIWTWTLAVILLIFSCRMVSSRFRYFFGGPTLSSSSSSAPITPKTDDDIPSLRPGIISDLDLKTLMNELDDTSPDIIWENVVDKSTKDISYKAKCYKPKDGPLKYLSVTTFEDCFIELLLNFYMDNDYRMQWDKTMVHHQQLQVDRSCGVEIGRTIKKFPFVTAREYVLAWKLWQGMDGSFYCFSKECEHPLAPRDKRYIRVAVLRSGWRIRKVPGRNACEIRMVHQEDAGLNVEMAKLAFAKGIWSYVCKMGVALRKYSDEKHHQLNSTAGASMYIQKVPPEFEVTKDMISTAHQENLITTVPPHIGNCRPNTRKFTRRPSNKFIANSLVLLGGAICLSRGHSSLGAKVAMAYIFSKLTNRGASSKQAGNLPCNKGS
ncbi:uncharacterized protein LOC105157944 [Sesamum indicum]|uniref:Uncharacterized protein LOC105157944 n=1 Tax=Sesamum indicum TaxID=4182 RepID=A0A6I9SR26_SESIN|nr:uncharacterized protein LOC105157944 [Sesamum indicum]